MTVKIGIVMDPIDSINFEKDTSLAMLWAAKRRNYELFYMEQSDLYQINGKAMGGMSALDVYQDVDHWYDLARKNDLPLNTLDVILMRKDPPFDNEFIYSTYLLEQAERDGVLVVNKPQSLRDFNEKFFATLFPDCITSCIVSRDMNRLKAFAEQEKDVIFKPMDGMGGASIFRIRLGDPNVSVVLETLTKHGQEMLMGQKFIPEITKGDKRILMIGGEPVPYGLARIPKKGETRGNLAAGGYGVAQPLTERDLWIASQVGPVLREKELLFVGLDVIGNYLTEINVTSPTCVREIDDAFNLDIASQLMDCIEAKLKEKKQSNKAKNQMKTFSGL